MPSPSNFQTERYYSPKCITPCSRGTKKDQLNFLEIKVQLRKAPGFGLNPKIQEESAQATNLRSQIWYPKTGKNRSGEGWARAEEKLSIREEKS